MVQWSPLIIPPNITVCEAFMSSFHSFENTPRAFAEDFCGENCWFILQGSFWVQWWPNLRLAPLRGQITNLSKGLSKKMLKCNLVTDAWILQQSLRFAFWPVYRKAASILWQRHSCRSYWRLQFCSGWIQSMNSKIWTCETSFGRMFLGVLWCPVLWETLSSSGVNLQIPKIATASPPVVI